MESRGGAIDCPPITEKLVARIWEEQRPLVFPLLTTWGEEIQAVYPGRRRWDRGPDFAGALIAWTKARLCHGEVEVHVRSSDWRAHGHHRDRHYNGVILQVVMWDDAASPSVREDGVVVPLVALANHLSEPLESLVAAPQTRLVVPSPCWSGIPEQQAPLADLFDRCGRERFAAKAACFESDLTCRTPDQLLFQGIAGALGYSQNSVAFRRLAEMLPLEVLLAYREQEMGCKYPLWETRPPDVETPDALNSSLITHDSSLLSLEALLLGAAGLLPSQRDLPVDEGSHGGFLEEHWGAKGVEWADKPMPAANWQFFRVRPANFPTRRVAALAAMVAKWPRAGLAEALAELVFSVEPKAVPRALEALLLVGGERSYWAHHYDFGLSLRRPGRLIGRARAAEIAVNVFLPFLAARASHLGDAGLERRVLEVYHLYPKRGDNEITRYMASQITGLPRPRVARSACRQQGLLHLYRTRCETKQCEGCLCRYPV